MKILFFAIFAGLLAGVSAQLPVARLDSIFPLGAKLGGAVEISIAGAELDEPRALIFDHPGITAESIEGMRFKISVAPDVPAGIYELRFTGRWGVTSPCWFTVGESEEGLVPAEALDQMKAPVLERGRVYNGRCESGRAQYFKIAGKAGERLFVDCAAARIGSRMDAQLVLFDGAGRELARARESRFGDPLLDHSLPADGEYLLQVADFLAGGGQAYSYRLSIGTAPQIDYVLPASAVPGTKQTFQVFGRSLPGGSPSHDGLERVEIDVDLPAMEERRGVPLTPKAAGTRGFNLKVGNSQPYFVERSSNPVSIDVGGNTASDSAQGLSVPCEISGRFQPGSSEWFGFEAKNGKVYSIDVTSQRLDAPSDPVIEVFKVAGDALTKLGGGDDEAKNLGGRAYRTNHRDPSYRFTADADGEVRVALRDQFGTTAGFQLTVDEAAPDFELLVANPVPPGDNNGGKRVFRSGVALRRGDTVALPVIAIRRDGFADAISLEVEGLPTGIEVAPSEVAAGGERGSITLRVGRDAPPWSGKVRVFGRSGERRREAEPVFLGWTSNDADQERVSSQVGKSVAIACIEEVAPIEIAPGEDRVWETSLGGKLEIPVKLTKSAELKDKINVRVVGLPGMGNKPAQVAIEKDKDTGVAVLQLLNNRDNNKFVAGTHQFSLQASTKVSYRRDVEKSTAAEEAKKAALADFEAKRKARDEAKRSLDGARASKAETEEEKARGVAEAEAAFKTAGEDVVKAEAAKKAAEAKAKSAAERAKPRDLLVTNRTFPITLKIAEAPLKLTFDPAPLELKKGAQVEIPLSIERLYGFADEVRVSAKLPEGTKGIAIPEVKLGKDVTGGPLVIQAAGEATAGALEFELVAKMKFNGVDLEVREAAKLTVSEP